MGATAESIDAYLRSCLTFEPSAGPEVRANLAVPEDLQGPPKIAHGGGVATILFETMRAEAAAHGDRDPHAGAVRLEASFVRALPLGTTLAVRAGRDASGVRAARVTRKDGVLLAEATLADAGTEAPQASAHPQAAGASGPFARRAPAAGDRSSREVPGTAMCLVCGSRNPRGLGVRLSYDDNFVWKSLSPPDRFRRPDGSLSPLFAFAVLDEIGWWLGALGARECGLTTALSVTLRPSAASGGSFLVVGERAASTSDDLRGRTWRSSARLLDAAGDSVATATIAFAASRAFTRSMAAGLFDASDRDEVVRLFPAAAPSAR